MRYEPIAHDEPGGPVCSDCLHFCTFATPLVEPCRYEWCCCERCIAARRAAEDNSPENLEPTGGG